LNRNKVIAVRTLQLNGISFPPGKTAAELEGLEAWKDIVEKPSAHARGIMAANFKALPDFMTGAAVSFDA